MTIGFRFWRLAISRMLTSALLSLVLVLPNVATAQVATVGATPTTTTTCATGATCAAGATAAQTAASGTATGIASSSTGGTGSTGSTGNCTYTALTVADTTLNQGIMGILNLVCSYHTASAKMITAISPNANAQMQGTDKAAMAISVLVKIFSIFVTITVTYGLVVLTLQVVEIAIRLTVYSVLMPFIVYSYIYPSTRYIFDNAVKGYIFVLFKFAFLGVFIAAALLMLQIATTAVGSAASAMQTVISDLTNTQAIVQVISYSVAAIAATLMTSRLMGSATNAAAAMTSYDYANAGIATGAMSALNTGFGMAVGAAGLAAYGATAVLGADARLLSRLMSRNAPGNMRPFMAKLEGLAATGGTLVLGKALYEMYGAASQTTAPLTSHDAPTDAQKIQNLTPGLQLPPEANTPSP